MPLFIYNFVFKSVFKLKVTIDWTDLNIFMETRYEDYGTYIETMNYAWIIWRYIWRIYGEHRETYGQYGEYGERDGDNKDYTDNMV